MGEPEFSNNKELKTLPDDVSTLCNLHGYPRVETISFSITVEDSKVVAIV